MSAEINDALLKAFVSVITDALNRGEEIEIEDFFNLYTTHNYPRRAVGRKGKAFTLLHMTLYPKVRQSIREIESFTEVQEPEDMNKIQLAQNMADLADVTPDVALKFLDALPVLIKNNLTKDKSVVLPNFGTFTGKHIQRPGMRPYRQLFFSFAEDMKQAVQPKS